MGGVENMKQKKEKNEKQSQISISREKANDFHCIAKNGEASYLQIKILEYE